MPFVRTASVRRFRALLNGLSPTSALRRDLDPAWMWDGEHELLATIAELVDQGNRYYVLAQSMGKTKLKPIKITRPTQRSAQQTSGTTHAELLSLVQQDRSLQ